MSGSLFKTKRFAPFFWTQFFGAFNDNVFKNAVIMLFAFTTATAAEADLLVNLSAGIFILPFFLFSALAGQIADKFEKSMLIRRVKQAEIVIMLIGAAGFYFRSNELLLTTLFLMGTQSAFFGPVKYSILPQHLKEEELVGGNGLVEMGTFVAILLGTIAGGLSLGGKEGGTPTTTMVSIAVLVIALIGYTISRGIPKGESNDPDLKIDYNGFRQTIETIRVGKENRTVFLSILGISWFWFYGALFLANFPGYTRGMLGGDETIVTLLLTAFSLGIGVGSFWCEKLSDGKIELGLVPLGAFGLTFFALDLVFATPSVPFAELSAANFFTDFSRIRLFADLCLIGLFGGFYSVPLYALIQNRSNPEKRSRVIAANNILNAVFMVVAAALGIFYSQLGFNAAQIFLVAALLNIAVAIYIFTLVPEFMMRFLSWMLMKVMYRIKKVDVDHVPDEGALVVVANHVSFVDALILAAAIRRPIRFVMYHKIFDIPVLSFIFRNARAIPIAPRHEDEALMHRAFDEVSEALREGEIVGIFPEGKITYDGELNEFKTGIEKIIERDAVQVLPVALRGLWGSFFSRKDGPAMTKPFRRKFRSSVTVACGELINAEDVNVSTLQNAVATLRGDEK